jgi:uncharacterized protein (DUF1330 family)
MSIYVIAQVDIHDAQEYRKYVSGFLKSFSQFKGEVLVVEDAPTILEGAWPWTRTAVIRFDNEAEARRWYDSPEYQAAAQFRLRAATTHLILAKGVS